MTGNLDGGLTTTVSLGYDQLQRLVLAAETLADDEADVDPEFAAALRADADGLRHEAAAGTVPTDAVGRSVGVEFSAALDD